MDEGVSLEQSTPERQHSDADPPFSPHTRRTYRGAFRCFTDWCKDLGVDPLPALPRDVARYLESLAYRGLRFASLRTARAAISHTHRESGYDDPFSFPELVLAFRCLREAVVRPETRSTPLTRENLEAVRRTACIPRHFTGLAPRTEDSTTAYARGMGDVALISVMREAGLRRSEAARLRWDDIKASEDGSATLVVRGGQADADTSLFISAACVQDLEAIRPAAANGTDRVFPLSTGHIGQRVRAAAKAAGLGDGYTPQSCRVGLVQDLSQEGANIARLMAAGRWKSRMMPGIYKSKLKPR